jgi:hypothetical protein
MIIELDDRLRKKLARKYWLLTRRTLVKCREAVVNLSEFTDPDRLKDRVHDLLNDEPMKKLIIDLWGDVGGMYAKDIDTLLGAKKNNGVKIETKAPRKDWNELMKKYAAERSLKKLQSIMNTEEEAINAVIDQVIQKSLDKGLGIAETRTLLKKDLTGEALTSIENWQAQRIAVTEVGSAQNTGAYLASKEYSNEVKKQWVFIPGAKSFRDNHRGFEAEGLKDMDYEYVSGLKHPGDPNGSAEEVINCYCSYYLETVN